MVLRLRSMRMDDASRYAPRDEGQVYEELRELYRPSVASRMEELLEELWEDPQFFAEIKERFEKGRLRGNYPALERKMSEVREDNRDMFIVSGGLAAMQSFVPREVQPWDRRPFDGSLDGYLEELYSGMAYTYADELPEFAGKWLEELTRVGYRGMATVRHEGGVRRLPNKQQADPLMDSAISRPLGVEKGTYPVTFENSRQILWLQLEGERAIRRGYKEVRVSDRPVRTNEAILAALTVLEGKQVDARQVREALEASGIDLDISLTGQYYEKREVPAPLPINFLEYVFLLLRYHRPDFDDLLREEKLDLIERTCVHINECIDAARKLSAFLEYGVPGKPQRGAARTADRDVRAAVRRDVDGWTYRRIGEELDVPLPPDFDVKGDHPTVRQMVSRGRSILERSLGKDGWRKHIEAMRTEAERWNALSDLEQCAEDLAEGLGMPYEEAQRICIEEDKRREERMRRENTEPEN
jgi:hypothetical protein